MENKIQVQITWSQIIYIAQSWFLKLYVYKKIITLKVTTGNSLIVQWLGLGAPIPVAQVQSLVRELRSCKPHGTAKKGNIIKMLTPVICGEKDYK